MKNLPVACSRSRDKSPFVYPQELRLEGSDRLATSLANRGADPDFVGHGSTISQGQMDPVTAMFPFVVSFVV